MLVSLARCVCTCVRVAMCMLQLRPASGSAGLCASVRCSIMRTFFFSTHLSMLRSMSEMVLRAVTLLHVTRKNTCVRSVASSRGPRAREGRSDGTVARPVQADRMAGGVKNCL